MPKPKDSLSKPFVITRQKHQLETAEDYTELIQDLIDQSGEARIRDIANHFGVSHVTAVRAIQRLARDGYVQSLPHQPIQLLLKGKKLAAFAKKRHLVLLEFLIKLGVPRDVAKIDAEGIEHHLSDETFSVMKKFIENN